MMSLRVPVGAGHMVAPNGRASKDCGQAQPWISLPGQPLSVNSWDEGLGEWDKRRSSSVAGPASPRYDAATVPNRVGGGRFAITTVLMAAVAWAGAAFGYRPVPLVAARASQGRPSASRSGAAPAPLDSATARLGAPAPAAAGASLVGAAACAPCHGEVHASWTAGRHSRMIQAASRTSVLGDFRQSEIRLRGTRYGLRAANGTFHITESKLSGAPMEHRVEFTLGSRRIQHYLTTVGHGRIVVLPPTWDVQRRQWFDSVEIIRPDEGDAKVVQQWNKNCVGCHVSEQDNRYEPKTRTYATTWRDEGTTCERCHGPGREHVARFQAVYRASAPLPTDAAIVRPAALGPARGTAVCAQCHSLRDVVAPGFEAGQAYDDFFVPKLEYTPRKDQDPIYWADGRPRRFSNDALGLWQSQCYLRGGATCATCHDAHRPNVDGDGRLSPVASNQLCARCHEGIAGRLETHTKHAASSAGSACVECHMPREVVSIKASIRDHSLSLPTPENSVRFGIPNACTTCHTTQSANWAVDTLRQWWPNGRRGRIVRRAEAFVGGRALAADALPGLIALASDDAEPPTVRANAVGYLRGYAAAPAVRAIETALTSADPIVRTVAASSGTQPALRSALERALGDCSRAVRVSALVSLVNLGAGVSDAAKERFRAVSLEFAAQAALHEDDAATQTDLGLIHLLNGDVDAASTALSIALDLSPMYPRTAFLMGLTRQGQGRLDEARRWFSRVPTDDPFRASAQLRLRGGVAPRER